MSKIQLIIIVLLIFSVKLFAQTDNQRFLVKSSVYISEPLIYYKFDETSGTVVTDASGNGFDGTINGATNWVEGYLDGALEFFGAENVTIPADQMGLTSEVGSVAFWLKTFEPTIIYTIFWSGDNTTGGGFGPENELHITLESAISNIWIGGEISFFLRGSPDILLHSDPEKGGADEAGNPPVNPILLGDNEWHHVAATWDLNEGKAKLYIDGVLIMEWEYESTGYQLDHIYLGQMANSTRRYTGKLDDFRIYSHALIDDEVNSLFTRSITADFIGTPTSGSAPLTVQFTDQSIGDINSRVWLFGDGDTSYVKDPVHIYESTGNFTVSLIVIGPDAADTLTTVNFIEVFEPTSVLELNNPIPTVFKLYHNYPNPFNPTTIINYSVPVEGLVEIKIYDVLGNEIAILVNEEVPPGNYNIELNAGKLSSGVYFYRMIAGKFTDMKKLILLK